MLLNQIEPTAGLCEKIILKINLSQRKNARVRFVFASFFAVVAFAALIPTVSFVGREISQSGFYNYLSLVFSDTGLAVTYWKDFAVLLAESLPLFGIMAVLAAVWVLMEAVKMAVEKVNFINRQLST